MKIIDNKIIDVREDEEIQEGMIRTAIHIPLGELPERLDELSKDDEYVLVCVQVQEAITLVCF